MLGVGSFPSAYERSAVSEERDGKNILTIHNNLPLPDKTIDNFESERQSPGTRPG